MLTKEIFFKKLNRLNVLEEYQKTFNNYWTTESENRLTELLKISKLYRDVICGSFILSKKWLIIADKIDSIKTNNIYKIKIKIR